MLMMLMILAMMVMMMIEGGLFGRLTTRRYNVGAAALHGSTTHTKTALNCGFLNILENSREEARKFTSTHFKAALSINALQKL